MPVESESVWDISLLGEVKVLDASGQEVKFPGKHSEALFAYLCLEPGKKQSRETLAELLWPLQELTSKRTRLRQELGNLRELFGVAEEGGLILADRTSIAVVAQRVQTDLQRFWEVVAQFDSHREEEAIQTALALYKGVLLQGHDELANGSRSEVEQALDRVLWRQAQRAREQGQYAVAVAGLQRILERNHLNLEAHSELMQVYQQQGQSGEVRRQYQEAERIWKELLDSPPPVALTELFQKLIQTQTLAEPPATPLRTPPVEEPAPEPIPTPPTPGPAPPSPRPWLPWLAVPLLLLVVGLAWRLRTPSKPPLARVSWTYLDTPGPGEKADLTNQSSDASAVAALPNGRICVVGRVDTLTEDVDSLAVFFSNDGKRKPVRERFSSEGHDCDRSLAVVADGSNHFYVAGESYFPEAPGRHEGWYLLLLKYDSEGKQIWKRFSDEAIQKGAEVCVAVDGTSGVYVGGTALVGGKPQPLLLRYDTSGERQWGKPFPIPGKETTLSALCAGNHGEVFFTGNTAAPGSPNTDWLVAAFSSKGEVLWQRQVEGPGNGPDKVGAIQVSRHDRVFVAGVQQLASPAGSVLTVARYSLSGDPLEITSDTEVQPDLRLESAMLSPNGLRLAVAGQFTHPDGNVESRVVVFDEEGKLRWKLPLVAQKPDRSLVNPRLVIDHHGNVLVSVYATSESFFNLDTRGDSALVWIGPDGTVKERQRFASPDGSTGPPMDVARDMTRAICISGAHAIFVGQRSELGKVSALQVVAFDPLPSP